MNCPQCEKQVAREEQEKPAFCPHCRFPLLVIAKKYVLERALAEGGFGIVYAAYHKDLPERKRVIKVIPTKHFENETAAGRFRREVLVTALLSEKNEHIVRIYDDFGEEEQLGHFYVMEYLRGKTLAQHLSQGRTLAYPLVFHIFEQLCKALGAAHKENIVHRDLKPDNIFLIQKGDEPYFVKVIDFGIAKPMESQTQMTKGMLGTPQYMSPEQCRSEPVDPRADIYSLGLLFYRMLTGALPYEVERDEVLSWLMAHLSQEPIPLRQRRPSVAFPDGLEQALFQALAKEADERYDSVELFWRALQPFGSLIPQEHDASVAPGLPPTGDLASFSPALSASVSPPAPVPASAPTPQSMASSQSTTSPTARLPWPVWALLGSSFLTMLFGIGWWLFAPKSNKAPNALSRREVPKRPPGRLHKAANRLRATRVASSSRAPTAPRPQPITRRAIPPLRPVERRVPERRRMPPATARPRPVTRRRAVRRVAPRRRRKRIIRTSMVPGADPQRTRRFRTYPITKVPRLLWTFPTKGLGRAAPVVAHDTVYVTSDLGHLYAVNAQTGRQAWSYRVRRTNIHWRMYLDTPAVIGSRLYFARGGSVEVFHATEGRPLNVLRGGRHGIRATPSILGRMATFTSGRLFYIVDRFNNNRIASWRTGGTYYGKTAVDKNLIFFGNNDGHIYIVDVNTRKYYGTVKFSKQVVTNPVVYKGVVYGADIGGEAIAFDLGTKKVLWKTKLEGGVYISPAVGPGTVLFATDKALLVALHSRNGKRRWRRKTGGKRATSPPCTVGRYVYYGSFDRHIYARDLYSGRLRWKLDTGIYIRSGLVFDNGTLYVHAGDGTLRAYR